MSETVPELEAEARKIALNVATNKHDAIHGRFHPLTDPDIHKSAIEYERIGAKPRRRQDAEAGVETVEYQKDEIIFEKGEPATTICEVIKGSAYLEGNPEYVYEPGEIFGASALASKHARMESVLAGEDGTAIAFYNLLEYGRANPARAKELYNGAMDDVFEIIHYYEETVEDLEKELGKLEKQNSKLKEQAKAAKVKSR
jgi:CRP-like cAMP-binding protein